jgi:D-alanyl-lipoteichoic acid acyltransferase DltB (MBOAT superfamily)
MQDTSDEQWGKLKPFALPLILGMFAHCAVGCAVSRSVAEGARERALVVWQAAAGVTFCVFLHGPRAIWAVAVCVLNYGVCVLLDRRLLWQQLHALPCAAWALNISLLLLCNLFDGFAYVPFASWAGAVGAALDRLVGDGAYNWQIQFNLTFLRLISFCMDRFWSLAPADQQHASARPVKSSNGGGGGKIIGLSGVASDSPDLERIEELRADTCLPPHKYSLLHMLAYVFYIPLYIAGPIVPFNAFARLSAPCVVSVV